jgi:hypothetical protein
MVKTPLLQARDHKEAAAEWKMVLQNQGPRCKFLHFNKKYLESRTTLSSFKQIIKLIPFQIFYKFLPGEKFALHSHHPKKSSLVRTLQSTSSTVALRVVLMEGKGSKGKQRETREGGGDKQ